MHVVGLADDTMACSYLRNATNIGESNGGDPQGQWSHDAPRENGTTGGWRQWI